MMEKFGLIVLWAMIPIVVGVIAAVLQNKKWSESPCQGNTVTVLEKAAQGNASHILVTTTPVLEGYHITKYIEVVSAETVLGTGFFTEFAAWMADRFSAESSAIERKFKAAREMSLRKLREQALAVGADAVIGTSFAYSSNSHSMVSVIVTGTAVNTEPFQH